MDHGEMYRTAEGFYFAMHLLKRRTIGELKSRGKGVEYSIIGPTDRLFSPKFAMMAFSLELYLKALLQRETGSVPRVRPAHDLYALFQALPDKTKTAIIGEYDNCPPFALAQRAIEAKADGIPEDFLTRLQRSKDAFVQQRYIYEGMKGDVLLEDVVSAVRTYIFRTYEDWMLSVPPIDLSVPLVTD